MAVAREARVILARSRGRLKLSESSFDAGAGEAAMLRALALPASPAAEAPSALPPRPLPAPDAGAENLALPGFEVAKRIPLPPPGGLASAALTSVDIPLTLRDDLPRELEGLRAMVAGCRKCGLCETRTQTVFADGPGLAKLVFVGEAPGRDEDLRGVPFVGRAGQLLDKMIAAIDMKREEVYICNVLKCRPPDNRTPAPEEVAQCRPYLEQQLALVRPVVICALGLSAAQALLETKATMGSMRGKTFSFRGIPLIPTYHPAALLRNPGLKRDAWIDLQRVRDLVRSVG